MARSTLQRQPPAAHDWRTTDEGEIERRRLRARDGESRIANADPRQPVFSDFRVASASGLTCSVEVRGPKERQWGCDCVDFRVNGLGMCKPLRLC